MKQAALIELHEPPPAMLSDLDSRYEAPRASWVLLTAGWLIFAALVALPLIWTIVQGIQDEERDRCAAQEMHQTLKQAALERARLDAIHKEINAIKAREKR